MPEVDYERIRNFDNLHELISILLNVLLKDEVVRGDKW